MTRLLLFVLFSILYQAEATFDCRRPEQSCVSGTCSFASPTCSGCNAGFEGDDCGLETALKGVAPCDTSNPCVAGECWNDGGTAKCYCPPDKYGDNCEENRFAVDCKTGFMVLGVNPGTTAAFNGIAYIEGKRGIAACETTAVPTVDPADDIPDTWLGQAVKVDDSSADCDPITATIIGGKTTYTRKIVVQYNQDLVTSRDDLFTATCTFDEAGVVVESSMVKVDETDLGGLNPTDTEGQFSPVTLTLTSGGLPVDPATPIKVGAEILFTFTIPSEYDSMRITSGEANNTKPVGDADVKMLTIITGSCVDDAAYQLTNEAPALVGGSKREISLKMQAFHFYGNDQVIFKFNVKVCLLSNTADCDPIATCPGEYDGAGYGRRKRAADDEEVIERIVTVIDPNRSGQTDEQGTSESECRTTGEITAALIAMGIIIFTLLVMTTILFGKVLMSRPGRGQSKQDLFSAQSVQSLPRI